MPSTAAAGTRYLSHGQFPLSLHTGLSLLTRGPLALCLLLSVVVGILARYRVGVVDLLSLRHGGQGDPRCSAAWAGGGCCRGWEWGLFVVGSWCSRGLTAWPGLHLREPPNLDRPRRPRPPLYHSRIQGSELHTCNSCARQSRSLNTSCARHSLFAHTELPRAILWASLMRTEGPR